MLRQKQKELVTPAGLDASAGQFFSFCRPIHGGAIRPGAARR